MKFFKNLFASKPKKNTKYEPNTLAEMNGSPDLRLATAKEKEVDYPFVINDGVKKIPKKSSKTSSTKAKAANTGNSTVKQHAVKETAKTDKIKVVSTEKTTVKSASTSTKYKLNETKKSETASSDTAKNSTAGNIAKKQSDKSETASKETVPKAVSDSVTKKDTKPTSTAKNTSKQIEKKAQPASAVKNPTATKDSSKKITKKNANNSVDKKTDEVTESKTTRSGKFEIKKSKDGRFVFNLYASNNVIVATSQIYSSSASAMNGIKSVIANAASAQIEDQSLKKVTTVPFPKWEMYLDKGEQYRFRLCASNGSCVCHSQGYTSKANCKKGIESIIKFANDAEITKAYLEKKDK